ncbi:MAG: hypothetical protein HYV27_15375 [Candidatus Hydrogenedentes bacterium]|nr:hypothetical protein [Candidatus Hydrogenedentota bacterium]
MSYYVDLDGTLAQYEQWEGPEVIGEPVPAMMERVRAWQRAGKTVKIFTARASVPENIPPVERWLAKHGLHQCEVTAIKGFDGLEFWDDRAVTVEKNTGRILTR